MGLPSDFIEEFSPPIPGISIMGHSLTSLSKKELQATIVFLIAEVEEKKEVLNRVPTLQIPTGKRGKRGH